MFTVVHLKLYAIHLYYFFFWLKQQQKSKPFWKNYLECILYKVCVSLTYTHMHCNNNKWFTQSHHHIVYVFFFLFTLFDCFTLKMKSTSETTTTTATSLTNRIYKSWIDGNKQKQWTTTKIVIIIIKMFKCLEMLIKKQKCNSIWFFFYDYFFWGDDFQLFFKGKHDFGLLKLKLLLKNS